MSVDYFSLGLSYAYSGEDVPGFTKQYEDILAEARRASKEINAISDKFKPEVRREMQKKQETADLATLHSSLNLLQESIDGKLDEANQRLWEAAYPDTTSDDPQRRVAGELQQLNATMSGDTFPIGALRDAVATKRFDFAGALAARELGRPEPQPGSMSKEAYKQHLEQREEFKAEVNKLLGPRIGPVQSEIADLGKVGNQVAGFRSQLETQGLIDLDLTHSVEFHAALKEMNLDQQERPIGDNR